PRTRRPHTCRWRAGAASFRAIRSIARPSSARNLDRVSQGGRTTARRRTRDRGLALVSGIVPGRSGRTAPGGQKHGEAALAFGQADAGRDTEKGFARTVRSLEAKEYSHVERRASGSVT